MDDFPTRSDADLEEALEETFPASDPPANTVETGIVTRGLTQASGNGSVIDNPARRRFELAVDDQVAFLVYERTDDALTLVHTAVPPALRGRHLGEALVAAALEAAHSAGLRVIARCPFVREYLRRHPASA